MKGSIRFFVGLIMVFGAVGGMENSSDVELPIQLAFAALGLFAMYSGSKVMKNA